MNKTHTIVPPRRTHTHTPVYWLQTEAEASQRGAAYRWEPQGGQMLP